MPILCKMSAYEMSFNQLVTAILIDLCWLILRDAWEWHKPERTHVPWTSIFDWLSLVNIGFIE